MRVLAQVFQQLTAEDTMCDSNASACSACMVKQSLQCDFVCTIPCVADVLGSAVRGRVTS